MTKNSIKYYSHFVWQILMYFVDKEKMPHSGNGGNNARGRTYNTILTLWKVPKYGVASVLYVPVFSTNRRKHRSEKTPYLDVFHSVCWTRDNWKILNKHDLFFPSIYTKNSKFIVLFKFSWFKETREFVI